MKEDRYIVAIVVVWAMKGWTSEVILLETHPLGEGQVDFGFAKVIKGMPTQAALYVMSLS